jgi:hypothetical protein
MPASLRQRSARPTRKVMAGGAAGMVGTILVFVAARLWHVDVPPDVAAAVAGLLVTVVGAVVAYAVPPAVEDAPVPAARRPRDPIGH